MVRPSLGCRASCLALSRIIAILCLFAAPVQAAVPADFNGDGIADRVDLPHHRHSSIVVELSGAPAAVLPLRDAVVAVVAIDLDHDGNLDIGALTAHHRVLIWVNRGEGRFTAVHRRKAPRELLRSQSSSATDRSDVDPSAAPGLPTPAGEFFNPSSWGPAPSRNRRLADSHFSAPSSDFGHRHRGRAPPLSTPS